MSDLAATSTATVASSLSTTATSTTTSLSRTPDAQTWVFPPPGPTQLPLTATTNFGPLAYNDTMLLEWAPETRPEIYMSCFTLSLRQTTFKVVTAGAASTPFNYQLNVKVNSTGTSDLAYCHYWFNPSNNGNSGNFQYLNDPSPTPKTISAGVSKATASSSISSSTAASASNSSNSSDAANSTTSQHSGGLSSGAKAGIGIGVAFGIIGLILTIFFIMRRRRQQAVQQAVHQAVYGHAREMHSEPVYDKLITHSVYEKRLSTPPVEMDAGVVGHEMPGQQQQPSQQEQQQQWGKS